MTLQESRIDCPYCGEPIILLIDEGDAGVDYIEDCQVCCRPMVVLAFLDSDGDLSVQVQREDE
ncbi:MAG: CPXCG motif-containing cysteine-rich protein, partial [Anderseniella sp.]|nr:CPXCG motif-containing cysteine-rich protein [Anderseniella sp.]